MVKGAHETVNDLFAFLLDQSQPASPDESKHGSRAPVSFLMTLGVSSRVSGAPTAHS
jgi:hypothetical protein